jgi:hypothetical protein
MRFMGFYKSTLSLMVALAPAAAQADCPSPATAVDVIESAEGSANAYRNADLLEFVKTTTKLEAQVPCMAEPLPRNVVANVHRMMGLRAFVDQKREKAEQAFGAARSIEPAYRFPETMVPPGHPIMEAYEALAVDDVTTREIPAASGGYFQFDGRPSQDRPISFPTVAQLFNGDGGVEVSAYLWPADGMFDYVEGDPALPAGMDPSLIDLRPTGPNLPLLASAGGAAVLAGVSFGIASASASQFASPETPYADGAKLRSRTNTFTVVSGGAGAAALGLGVGAILAGRW